MSSHCYLAEIHFGCPALAWEEKGWSHPVRTKSSVVSGRKVRSVSRKVEKGGKQEPFKSGPIKPEAGLKLRSVSKDTDLYLSWCMYGSSTATNICAHPHCISSPSPCFRRVFCACFWVFQAIHSVSNDDSCRSVAEPGLNFPRSERTKALPNSPELSLFHVQYFSFFFSLFSYFTSLTSVSSRILGLPIYGSSLFSIIFRSCILYFIAFPVPLEFAKGDKRSNYWP
jgi:hypothetical protein